MKTNTQRLLVALLMTGLFAACSRPVAYFQKSPREHFTSAPTVGSSGSPAESVATLPVGKTAPTAISPLVEQSQPVELAPNQPDVLVSNDSKVTANKSLQKRIGRVQTLLASASLSAATTPSAVNATRKANLMERLVMKKLNKKINKQLAPANPNKPMINSGILATGAVLVLIGLLLLLLTSGTASTVGIIVLLAGAVLLLVGLL